MSSAMTFNTVSVVSSVIQGKKKKKERHYIRLLYVPV